MQYAFYRKSKERGSLVKSNFWILMMKLCDLKHSLVYLLRGRRHDRLCCCYLEQTRGNHLTGKLSRGPAYTRLESHGALLY